MLPIRRSILLTTTLLAATLIAVFICGTGQLRSQSKIRIPQEQLATDSLKVWIYFVDKGESRALPIQKATISQAARTRRDLRGTLADYAALDREVSSAYVELVRPLVRRLVQRSRWLNAVSAIVSPGQLVDLAQLGCITEIRPVARFIRPTEPSAPLTDALLHPAIPFPPFYGPSYAQLNQIQVPLLHDQGLTGEGIRILMLDTGYKIDHSAFASTDIEATYDFINDDEDVVDDGSIEVQQVHGTATLSLIGASEEGKMIGAAYGATFLLAKTEVQPSETPIEEDYWVAGIEWGEGLGADVVSSSLGYTDWYSYADMDGNTAVVTKAADIAASLGVMVVNAIGNDQRISPQPTLIAPSDGDSVIAVGAVDNGGEIAHFSSNGPTADGRIKPDVCAWGVNNYIAISSGSYATGSGTSYSTPLVAGVVALLLQAHPEWKYGDIHEALTRTATRAIDADSVYGYGVIRAKAALNYDGTTPTAVRQIAAYPNPFSESIEFDFEVPPAGAVEIRIYTIAGEKIATLTREASDALPLKWQGDNDSGEAAAPGVYMAHISAPGLSEIKKIVKTK